MGEPLIDFGFDAPPPQQPAPAVTFDPLDNLFSTSTPQTTKPAQQAAPIGTTSPTQPQADFFSAAPAQSPPAASNDPWGIPSSTAAQPAQTPAQPAQNPAPIVPAVSPEDTSASATLATATTMQPDSNENNGGAVDIPPTIDDLPLASGQFQKLDDEDKFIKDPELLEIKKKFSGKWKLVRSDPYDEYLKHIGVGLMTRKLANTNSLEQVIYVKDNGLHIELHSTFYNQIYQFRLNESTDNMINKIKTSVFCNFEKERLFLQMTTVGQGFEKTLSEERFLNDLGELVVNYNSGPKSCRRFFQKIPEVPHGQQA